MKTKALQKKKIKSIVFTYKSEVIKIELDKDESIQDKNDLKLLPIIRNTRKPPRRYPKKEEPDENIIESVSSLEGEINSCFHNLPDINDLFNIDTENNEWEEINEIFIDFN